METKELKNTKWAKEFKKESPSSYNKALELASNPNIEFSICETDESGETIHVVSHNGFWMNGFTNKKEAIHLCKEMNWKYKII